MMTAGREVHRRLDGTPPAPRRRPWAAEAHPGAAPPARTAAAASAGERRLAARVLNALLRENYGGIAARVTRDRNGIALVLASGRSVPLAPGAPFQDFAVPDGDEGPDLAEVLQTLAAVADPADAAGVAAFVRECHEALAALNLHEEHRDRVSARLAREEPGVRGRPAILYETLAAGNDHPIYPTSRCRLGLSAADLIAYAPEFAPVFELAWAAVPGGRVVLAHPVRFAWWPEPGDVGLPRSLSRTHVLFPVHPLTVPVLADVPGLIMAPRRYLPVRPTLSMRTVEVDRRTHLKLPLPTSTLGLRNRRSIKPGTLRDGALAESLLRAVVAREPRSRIVLADEQAYGHAGHEYLGWLVRRLPPGEIVPVAALLAELPEPGRAGGRAPRLVLHDLADRFYGGDVPALLRDYLATLFAWHVTLFVRYGIALETHQQNLSLLFGDGPMRLLIKDNDGLLASPDRLRDAGLPVPGFGDDRMLTGDPYALADVFVTITLHLAAMAVAHGATTRGALPGPAAALVREALAEALGPFGDDPMARLLRARTLDADRLVGKSMVIAGTLVSKDRTGARDINKFYGTTGPNYLRLGRSPIAPPRPSGRDAGGPAC